MAAMFIGSLLYSFANADNCDRHCFIGTIFAKNQTVYYVFSQPVAGMIRSTPDNTQEPGSPVDGIRRDKWVDADVLCVCGGGAGYPCANGSGGTSDGNYFGKFNTGCVEGG